MAVFWSSEHPPTRNTGKLSLTGTRPRIDDVQYSLRGKSASIRKAIPSYLPTRNATLGIGAGQMSRVDSAKIAIVKACASLKGSAVASDAFLPFPDTLEVAAAAGVTALVQPGRIYPGQGSNRSRKPAAYGNGLYGRTVLQALICALFFQF